MAQKEIIVSDGDVVVIDGFNEVVRLYIDQRESLGFKVGMIYKPIGYDKLKKRLKK